MFLLSAQAKLLVYFPPQDCLLGTIQIPADEAAQYPVDQHIPEQTDCRILGI
jgi:hypothetical protein